MYMNIQTLLHTSLKDSDTVKKNLRKYAITHCLCPNTIKSFDPISGTFKLREVSCGKCAVCADLYKNSWYSRMYFHSLYYEYIYFVTLTYSPFDSASVPDYVFKAAQEEFACTFPNFDSHNMQKRICLSSCVLYKPHLQNFFKRLRKQTGADLSYFACGEYGRTYGRPHYHAIIWSHQPLHYAQIKRAWSKLYYISTDGNVYPYRGQKYDVQKRFVHLFGNVDFHDLVRNGTLAHNTKSCEISGKNAFSYVCKYVSKLSFNDVRVKFAYNYHYYPLSLMFQRNDDILKTNINSNLYDYAKEIFEIGAVKDYSAFRRLFSPFVVCSRAPGIGLQYFIDNFERFQKGCRELSCDFQGKQMVFPAYFERKLQEALFGLRHERYDKIPLFSLSSSEEYRSIHEKYLVVNKKQHASRSLSLGSLPLACRFWSDVTEIIRLCPDISSNEEFIAFARKKLHDVAGYTKSFDDQLSYFDVNTRQRFVFNAVAHGFDLVKYSRHDRAYRNVGFMSFDDFYQKYLLTDLTNYLDYIVPLRDKSEQDKLKLKVYLEKAKSICNDCSVLDNLRYDYITERDSRQKMYDLTHENDL